jgi:hypothetical protein
MKRIKNADKVPEGYVLDMNVTDDLGRNWKYRASPDNKAGSIAYFNNLSEIRKWKTDVKEIRDMQEGKETLREKIYNNMLNGEVGSVVALGLLKHLKGE